ncbi:MAG: hypothetical protein V9G18_13265 [Albidovulum sp.]
MDRGHGFDTREKHQSQVPALQLLVALGFTPLSQEEALRLRGGRLRNVVLDDVLAEQLMRINRFTHRGREYGSTSRTRTRRCGGSSPRQIG